MIKTKYANLKKWATLNTPSPPSIDNASHFFWKITLRYFYRLELITPKNIIGRTCKELSNRNLNVFTCFKKTHNKTPNKKDQHL